ncbi:MAG TPA: HAD-IIB family hydrolase [Candidatus Bathyarchaeia archaeon]|nr:HAD-IIB family hydrolase [Candidatus Bathyarchaeia archaeon]
MRIIIFDLDGTLAKSKSKLDNEMAALICELLRERYVAVASGGSFQQFEKQFLSKLPKRTNLRNLFLFPTSAATGYYYDAKRGSFSRAYSNLLSKHAAERIVHSFEIVFKEIGYVYPKKTYGQVFENRGSQITFSALGQKAPLRIKQRWDPSQEKRLRIRRGLKRHLANFEITIGGTTSIDVTEKGVNKTLCVKKLKDRLKVERKNMLYVGDALFRGGNDYVMRSTGIKCVPVSGPEETKTLIRRIIQN